MEECSDVGVKTDDRLDYGLGLESAARYSCGRSADNRAGVGDVVTATLAAEMTLPLGSSVEIGIQEPSSASTVLTPPLTDVFIPGFSAAAAYGTKGPNAFAAATATAAAEWYNFIRIQARSDLCAVTDVERVGSSEIRNLGHTCFVQQGFSGAPLLARAQGHIRLLGIHSGAYPLRTSTSGPLHERAGINLAQNLRSLSSAPAGTPGQ